MNIIKTKNYPKSIFKYCHLKTPYGFDNLVKNQIYLSNPLGFNDPYDCSVTFNAEKIHTIMANINIKTILDKFPEEELSIVDKNKILSNDNPKEKLLEIINNKITTPEGIVKQEYINNQLRPQINNKLIDTFNEIYKDKLRVSSFSEGNNSLLMWSHYADCHKGFCTEYDIESISEDENLKKYLFPIEYTESIYDITQFYIDNIINNNPLNVNTLIKSVLYKSKEWEYENEWRFVITTSEYSRGFVKIPKPKAIYLGSKIYIKHKEQFIKLCQTNNILLFQMKLDNKYFKMISEPIKL